MDCHRCWEPRAVLECHGRILSELVGYRLKSFKQQPSAPTQLVEGGHRRPATPSLLKRGQYFRNAHHLEEPLLAPRRTCKPRRVGFCLLQLRNHRYHVYSCPVTSFLGTNRGALLGCSSLGLGKNVVDQVLGVSSFKVKNLVFLLLDALFAHYLTEERCQRLVSRIIQVRFVCSTTQSLCENLLPRSGTRRSRSPRLIVRRFIPEYLLQVKIVEVYFLTVAVAV
mmetsp:Transcript_32043/g.72195  ORF Transcript_32043/g.72195 Transcript_32043/m.72195 type:complete len:224 (+) Transcript_32043:1171-1842(+)